MEQLTLKAIRMNLNLNAEEMAIKCGLKNGYQWYRRENYNMPIEAKVVKEIMKLTGLRFEQIKID